MEKMHEPWVAERWSRLLRLLSAIGAVDCAAVAIAATLGLSILFDVANWEPDQVSQLFGVMYSHGVALAVFGLIGLAAGRLTLKSVRRLQWMLVVILVLSLISADRLVGVFYPPAEEYHSFLTPNAKRGWAHMPNANVPGIGNDPPIRINSLGLRGPDIPAAKPAGEQRIMFLGDSISFGFQVDEEGTPEAQTRTLLNASGDIARSFTCVNAGVTSYMTWQEIDLFKEVVDQIQPSLVLLQFCINDVLDLSQTEEGRVTVSSIATIATGSNHWSGVYRAISALVEERRNREWRKWDLWNTRTTSRDNFLTPDLVRTCCSNVLASEMVGAWKRQFSDFEILRAECLERRIDLAILYFPTMVQLMDDADAPQPQRRVGEWCEANGVDFPDTTSLFRERMARGESTKPKYLFDWCHPTRAGNAVAAADVARFIIEHPQEEAIIDQ